MCLNGLVLIAPEPRGIGRFGDAGKCVAEAITGGGNDQGKVVGSGNSSHAGEIAFLSPERDVAKAFCTRNFRPPEPKIMTAVLLIAVWASEAWADPANTMAWALVVARKDVGCPHANVGPRYSHK